MKRPSIKNKITLLFKITVTVILLYYVVSLVDTQELMPLISNINWGYLAIAIVCHVIAFLVMSIRWWLILNSSDFKIEYSKITGAYYLGLFFNNFLPTAMGGDVVRIAKLRMAGISTDLLIFSTLSDRIVGLLSIIVMGIIGVNFSATIQQNINNETLLLINTISIVLFGLFISALNTKFRDLIFSLTVQKIRLWNRLNNFLVFCHKNIESLKNNTMIPKSILLSLISQLLIVFTYFFIGKSLNIELGLLEYVLVVPVVALFSSLPISVGGLGVREGVMVFLLTTAGTTTSSAVSVSIVYLSVLIFITLPGGLYLLSTSRKQQDLLSN